MYHFGMGSERMSPMSRNDGEVCTERLQSDPNVSGFNINFDSNLFLLCAGWLSHSTMPPEKV